MKQRLVKWLQWNRQLLFVRLFGVGCRVLWQYVPGQTPRGVYGDAGQFSIHAGSYRVEVITGGGVR